MKSSAKNVTLTSVDDLFTTEEEREDKKREKVRNIPLSELHPFRDHPFRVVDDEKMEETVESIREYGVLVPIIVRPKEEGGYEIVSGHRRCHASKIAGLETVPTIVRHLDDDEATIIMVDSNLQRESLLPSERAKAYKMKMDAMKRKAGRPSKENRGQNVHQYFGQKTRDIIAQDTGESARTVQRYIRLTELIPELLDTMQCEFRSLSYLPGRFPLVEEEPFRSIGVHKMKVKNYLVYYIIQREAAIVWITSIIYAKRNQIAQLLKMNLDEIE